MPPSRSQDKARDGRLHRESSDSARQRRLVGASSTRPKKAQDAVDRVTGGRGTLVPENVEHVSHLEEDANQILVALVGSIMIPK